MSKAPATAVTTANPAPMASFCERFMQMILSEFGKSVAGDIQVTDFQMRLIQGYAIAVDRALKMAEEERQRKNDANKDHKYDNDLPVNWQTVNLSDLALDLVHYARMGLDMQQDNMLFPIPYKNNKRKCYDVTLMEGYNGVRYIASKYALDKPIGETVELVYSTDTFIPHFRDSAHPCATYEFTINNAFNRGDIIGGFGYLEFSDPAKNILVMMSIKDILKRKPEHASANFWGGKSTEWQYIDGKRQKVEVEKDGWFPEMCRKTIIREVYSAKYLPRDPQKIDDAYQYLKMRESQFAEMGAQMEAQAEIEQNANAIPIDITPAPARLPEPQAAVVVPKADPATGEVISGQPVMEAMKMEDMEEEDLRSLLEQAGC